MKSIIHKIKWQTIVGWTIHNSYPKSLCKYLWVNPIKIRKNKILYGEGSFQWKRVSCKDCLKLKMNYLTVDVLIRGNSLRQALMKSAFTWFAPYCIILF